MKKVIVFGLMCCAMVAVGAKGPGGGQRSAPQQRTSGFHQRQQHNTVAPQMHRTKMVSPNVQRAPAVQAHQQAVARQRAAQAQQHAMQQQMKERAIAAEAQRRAFRHAPPPPNMHRWRRGHAPHPTYRSVWYGDVWYDEYGFPYYNPTVVTPVQTVVPAQTVVTPVQTVVPAQTVVTPVQTVAPAHTVVTPVQTVVQPAQSVVY